MNKLHVPMSPITHRIYAGGICKDGVTWRANKEDVTGQACAAVAQRVLQAHGGTMVVSGNGKPLYQITVVDLGAAESEPVAAPSVPARRGVGDW